MACPFQGRRGAVIQSWDTAYLTNRRSDYSVCTTWTFSENAYYLLSLWRAKVEFADLLQQVANQAEAWRPGGPRPILICSLPAKCRSALGGVAWLGHEP